MSTNKFLNTIDDNYNEDCDEEDDNDDTLIQNNIKIQLLENNINNMWEDVFVPYINTCDSKQPCAKIEIEDINILYNFIYDNNEYFRELFQNIYYPEEIEQPPN